MNNKVVELWRKVTWSMDNSDEYYSDADKRWLSRNIALLITFFDEADIWRARGKKRSQRAIAHGLRWDTAVKDDSEHFKIMNAGIALLAHVYNDYAGSNYFKTLPRKPFESK
ncbi:MAG: hypothetical protein OQK29_01295 [Ignavibacteriaceae bacterium]|nr:hypothetical protein [Ignavibacteriaceae bacterium]